MKQKQQAQVRIIGGIWRGRKLPVLSFPGLRPTGDRIRETLFNWLMHDITGADCLDCYAGSGALGFEALSRQASKVVFLEKNPTVAKNLQANIRNLTTIESATVFNTDCISYLSKKQNEPLFDIVFLDPPFGQNLLSPTIQLLETNNWVRPQTKIYLESEIDYQLELPVSWELLKTKHSGQVKYCLLIKNS